MIAAYTHNETKETVYAQDFTAKVVTNNLEILEDESPVIYKRENDITTYITSKEVFDKEYTKK
jgi:hypothetical protein